MKNTSASLGRAGVLAGILLHSTLNLSAQSGGYAVTERGPDFKALEKTTVDHGTNRVHRYTELANRPRRGMTRSGDERVAQLQLKPDEQNEFNLG
jgi:hypothetical protein